MVRLNVREQPDPLGILDPPARLTEPNQLVITNHRGLEVTLGGKCFKPARDHDGDVDVLPLTAPRAWLRTLISTRRRQMVDSQLVINVDRRANNAHAWSRARDVSGSMSPWHLAATYGRPPAAAWRPRTTGFFGQDEAGRPVRAVLDGDPTRPGLRLSTGPAGAARGWFWLHVSPEMFRVIGAGRLAALVNLTHEFDGTILQFRAEGRDPRGRPRVNLVIVRGLSAHVISDCTPLARGSLRFR